MAMFTRHGPLTGRRPGVGRNGLTLDEAQRLYLHARRLQGEAIAGAVRRTPAVLARALSAVLAFIRCAAAGQAKRVPSPADCGGA